MREEETFFGIHKNIIKKQMNFKKNISLFHLKIEIIFLKCKFNFHIWKNIEMKERKFTTRT
jgi:hypothetical protein